MNKEEMMGLKEKFLNLLQEQIGGATEEFLTDLKIIVRGKLTFELTGEGLKIKAEPIDGAQTAYVAILDKSTGKDITKIKIPISGLLKFDKISIPIEIIADLKK